MLVNDDACFACGQNNPYGLHLQFSCADDTGKVSTIFVPNKTYQGWKDIVHGGIILTVLDEAMAKAAGERGYHVLTGQIQAKFKAPARVQQKLVCEAEIVDVKRSIIYARSRVVTDGGIVIAEATAKMVIADTAAAYESALAGTE
ncbi:MAG: PaaI family thioesterase [Desulfobacterota bacterium]|nr:PaaI family thioesterase [Thermodesulfobacteriota bacterium]